MSLAAPKSTRSASAADDAPSASGVDVSQPAVGHGVAALSAATAAAAARSSAVARPSVATRRIGVSACATAAGALAQAAQAADDAGRQVVDREHEQDPEPEQPAIGRDQLRQHRNALDRGRAELHQVLQVVLRQHQQHAGDDGAVDRSHAADDDDQQHVEHDLERQRRVRAVVAQPEREQDAGESREQRRDDARDRPVDDGAVADRLGAEVVLADRLQDASERRVDDPQQRQHEHRRDDEQQVVGDEPAVDRSAEERRLGVRGARLQRLRHLERQAVLAAGDVGELRREGRERRGDGERDHGEEDRRERAG